MVDLRKRSLPINDNLIIDLCDEYIFIIVLLSLRLLFMLFFKFIMDRITQSLIVTQDLLMILSSFNTHSLDLLTCLLNGSVP